MKKDKQKALGLLKQKNNGEIIITYNEISKQTGYSKQLEILIRERDERLKARAKRS